MVPVLPLCVRSSGLLKVLMAGASQAIGQRLPESGFDLLLRRSFSPPGIFGSKGPLHDGAARILEANYKPPAIQQCAQQPTQVAEGTTQHQATGLRSLMPFLGQQKVQKTTVASNTTPKSPVSPFLSP